MSNRLKMFWKNRDRSVLFWAICFIEFIGGMAGIFFGIHLDDIHPSSDSGKIWIIISAIVLILGLRNLPGDIHDTGEESCRTH